MNILFNSSGIPLLMQSTYIFGETTGTPQNEMKERTRILAPYDLSNVSYIDIDGVKVRPWGDENDFPQKAAEEIGNTSVLNTGLKFLRNLTLGQGIYPCTVNGYDNDGNEILKPVTDSRVQTFIASRNVRRYMEKVLRDYLKFGNGAVQFVPSAAGNSFAGVNPVNALYRRYSEVDEYGACKCIVSGYWPQRPDKGQYTRLDVLSEYDPQMHAEVLKFAGKVKDGFIMPVRDSWSNDDLYGMPIWWPAYVCGWVEIAHLIPHFLKKAYKNQITWKWHVQIPYSYWEKKYPSKDYFRNLTLGQGIYPCTVNGYDNDGNEILKPVTDSRVQTFIASRNVRRYMEKVLRDYLKFGNGAVQFVPSAAGNSFAGVNPVNALYRRYSEVDEYGACKCIVSGYWPQRPDKGQYTRLDVLSEYDPQMHAEVLKFAGKVKDGFIMPVRDSWSNDDLYGMPIWWPAYVCGWVEIAHLIPHFLKKAYKNQITWKWHVQIPYSYWEKKYPSKDYSAKEREAAIQKYMDSVEQNLCGPDNAEKPIFSHYAVNEMNGRIEEEWKIKPLENKYQGSDNLPVSAAANSEILFALMVNPNVLGAGMPGGTYAGNQGGSNIREAFLVNIANAWIDRQNILDPIELYIKMNGMPECELRFRNTVLVTLDTGSGTKKTLS